MAWYHKYQYASLKNLRGKPEDKAYPILSYEIAPDDRHIVSVQLKISDTDYRWFDIGQIDLFKSPAQFETLTERHLSENAVDKFLKSLNLKRR